MSSCRYLVAADRTQYALDEMEYTTKQDTSKKGRKVKAEYDEKKA